MTALEADLSELAAAEQRLFEAVRSVGPVVVAFSGGVDSALLAHAALDALGPDRVLAVTARSDSLAEGELEHCRRLAADWSLPWQAAETREMDDPAYLANGGDRCFWCKAALMDAVAPLAIARSATVVLGVNVDDLGDHRPGQQAARERGARFPLVEAGLTKTLIRGLAQARGLEVWDRPAMPCLASRLPYGTPVSVSLLRTVDRAEAAVRGFGFRDVRVRHYGDTARVELPLADLPRALAQADAVTAAVRAVGFHQVVLDPEGLRSGNLNEALLTGARTDHG